MSDDGKSYEFVPLEWGTRYSEADLSAEPCVIEVVQSIWRSHEMRFPRSLKDFIGSLQEVREDFIPGEFSDTATIELETEEYLTSIIIKYRRPETPTEVKQRVEAATRAKAAYDKRERAEFERLKDKFRGEL